MSGEVGVESGAGAAGQAQGGLREGSHVVDGLRAHYTVADPPDANRVAGATPLIFIHGMGGSAAHFSKNLLPIAAACGAPVYAVDLLGFGRSAKPLTVDYGESLWTWQIKCLVDDVVKTDQVFVAGNSLGGYLAMVVAATYPKQVAGLCVLNACAASGVINPSGLAIPVFRIPFVADFLAGQALDTASTAKGVRSTLEEVYMDPSKVDDDLVKTLTFTGKRAGGLEVYKSLYKSYPGRSWEELLVSDELGLGIYAGPLLAIWGQADKWMPPKSLDVLSERQDFEVTLVTAGHCPHDEVPEMVNRKISAWMAEIIEEGRNTFEVARVPRYKTLPLLPKYIF